MGEACRFSLVEGIAGGGAGSEALGLLEAWNLLRVWAGARMRPSACLPGSLEEIRRAGPPVVRAAKVLVLSPGEGRRPAATVLRQTLSDVVQREIIIPGTKYPIFSQYDIQ